MEDGPSSPSVAECSKPVSGPSEPRTPTKNKRNKSATGGHYSPHLRSNLAAGSPSKEKSCDRFIPTRNSAHWDNNFSLAPEAQSENGEEGREQQTYRCLLQNELLGANIDDIKSSSEDGLHRTPHKRRLFHYQSPSRQPEDHGYSLSPVSRLAILKFQSGTDRNKFTTNQNSLFRSRDWLSVNQGPVSPDSVSS
eukprot:sb/3470966/